MNGKIDAVDRAIQLSIQQLNNAMKKEDHLMVIILRERLSRLFYEAACNGTVYQKAAVQ